MTEIPPVTSVAGRETAERRSLHIQRIPLGLSVVKTNVYVDGFNLYYGSVKGTPYKWLDLRKLCNLIFPNNELHRIRYFTALVKNTGADPTKSQRQQTFIRALETLPGLTVHYGSFLATRTMANREIFMTTP